MAERALLRAFAEHYPSAVFVEIGANDGVSHDPLRPHIAARDWTGVMVEPVPHVFARLVGNYGHLDRLALENVAIAERDGTLPFFHLAPSGDGEELPDFYDALGSFSREAVLSHADRIPDIEGRLVRREVPCLTFASLCARHRLDGLDLLLIDTEGHDARILEQVDLAALAPRLVIYEHFHLAGGERAACRARMEAAGYATMEEGLDTLCLRTGPDDALSAAWRGLRPAIRGVCAADPVP